jgi:hypothetical protein
MKVHITRETFSLSVVTLHTPPSRSRPFLLHLMRRCTACGRKWTAFCSWQLNRTTVLDSGLIRSMKEWDNRVKQTGGVLQQNDLYGARCRRTTSNSHMEHCKGAHASLEWGISRSTALGCTGDQTWVLGAFSWSRRQHAQIRIWENWINWQLFEHNLILWWSDVSCVWNCQEVHNWCVQERENPQQVIEYEPLIPKATVWCAVMKNNIIDPSFFEEPTRTGNNFPAMM